MPRSMCSLMPNPKLPVAEKFLFLSSYSLTFSPRSRISSAFGPRTVTWTAIFSFLRMLNDRMVYLALPEEMISSCSARIDRLLALRSATGGK